MKAIQHGGSGPHTEWQIYKKKKVKAQETEHNGFLFHFYLLVILSSEQLSIVVYKSSIGSVSPPFGGVGRGFLTPLFYLK